MGKRREGREVALQLLFDWDLNARAPLQETDLSRFWAMRPTSANAKKFAIDLVRGVIERQAVIDEKISRYALNYELRRIAAVDRNVLRLAIYEMLYVPDVPPIVAINEAIEIAKRFGTEESGRFVNGVLDRVKLDLSRPLRTAQA
jgi:N utilization substance protein B